MAKINRYNGNLQAPASAALGTERTIFGEVTQSDDLTDQFTADLLRGWGIVGPSDEPTLQDFNAMGFTLGQLHAYQHQVGVPEYNAAQEYHTGSFTNSASLLYVSLVDNNVGNPPLSSPAQWKPYGQEMEQALPFGYLSGFTLANNAGAPNTTVDTGPGTARSSDNTVDITITSTISGILQSSGAWAAGTGQNKLDTGAKAINSTYHEFVIGHPTLDDDVIYSLSATAPALPSGYAGFRWVGRFRTDSSGNIVPFIDYGNGRVDEKTAPAVATITATAGGYNQLVPIPGMSGKPCELIFNVFTLGDGAVVNVTNPASTDQLSTISATTYLGGLVANAGGGSSTEAAACQMSVFCDELGRVRVRTYNSLGGNTDARLVLVGRREVR